MNAINYVESAYLEFIERERKPKTVVVEILSKTNGFGLGLVKYYSPWRQYCFSPYQGTVYNHQCLEDIKKFLIAMNEERKIKNRPRDYCEIGMSHCVSCGWRGKYPVSGCPNCNRSFVE